MLHITRSNIYLLIITIGLLFSCGKDKDQQLEVTDIIPEPTEKVYSKIQGIILNEQEQIIEGVEVFVLAKKTQTDENGFFELEGFFPLDGTPIGAKKAGYFDSNGIILPQADGTTKVNIILVEQGQTETVETGRIINHQTDHASVLFPKDAFVQEDGAAFNGSVTINTKYFDPTHRTFTNSYPGFLKSQNLLETKALFPFSLIKITAVDESSRTLSVNQEIQLTIDIPEELLPFATPQIPLWFLDKETGFWIEEGFATLEGTTYVGTVTHLTDWVAALGLDYVILTGQITKEGAPFPYADVGISYDVGLRFSYRSGNQGQYALPIFIGGELYNVNFFKTINLDVRSNCGNILFEEKNISQPTFDLTKNIDVKSSTTFSISGQIFCGEDSTPLTDAYVLIQFEENSFQEIVTVDEQGKFELLIEECGLSEVSLVGFDPVNSEKSEPVNVVASNTTSVDLDVCEVPFQSKVTFELDGESYIINNCTVEKIDSVTYWHYLFTAIDIFPDFPEVAGNHTTYKINVFKYKNSEDIVHSVFPYTIPDNITLPDSTKFFAPYAVHFGTNIYAILSETEDQMIVNIPLGANYPGNNATIFRYSEPEEFDTQIVTGGNVLLEASK